MARKATTRNGGFDGVIVYIHGIGRQAYPPDALKLKWDLALFGRDLGAQSAMAYWADILHPPGEPQPSTASRGSDGPFDLQAAIQDAGLDPEDPQVAQFAASLGLAVGMPVPAVATVGKRVLPLPPFLRKPIAERFLRSFVADTAAYFFRPEVREACQQRLRDALPSRNQPVTLVAHSQGTVISFEVLAQMERASLDLIEFTTLGSPLGIQEVQDFLLPPSLIVPEVVQKWHSFADPLDPVALDKGLANDFEPDDVIQDALVTNIDSRRVAGFNPHSAVGYLAHPNVRRVVHDAMRLDTMSRFVIARDVAERLADESGQRHSVLIELLEPGYPAVGELPKEVELRERDEAVRLAEGASEKPRTQLLAHRIARTAKDIAAIVPPRQRKQARIDALHRFVAARLTVEELETVAANHRALNVYSVWMSSSKSKLLWRSPRVLKADAALASFAAGGAGITWAILDTGIRAGHPHFQVKDRNGNRTVKEIWDCTKQGPPQRVAIGGSRDPDGHGTHVAGIVAGKSPNGGERGLAPEARLVVYKVLDDRGNGEDAWIIKALDHIAETNANHVGDGLAIHGINLSLGGPFDTTVYGCGFSPVCQELRRQWRDGVLVVVACGNEGLVALDTPDGRHDLYPQISIGDPANLEDCIAVGSVHADRPNLYGVSSFSSRGPTADGRPKPDVVAPGENISSCNAGYRSERSWYFQDSGTSMAAPHVSGLLAAFLSVRREFRGRPDEVKKILLATCTDIGRDRYHQGHGVPNLMQMLLSV